VTRKKTIQGVVEVAGEYLVGGVAGRRKCSDHEHSRTRERGNSLPGNVSESPLDHVALHRGPNGLADHEAHLGLVEAGVEVEVEHQGAAAGSAATAHAL
jgi:hypothetical protein